MINNNISIQDRSYNFANRVIKAHIELGKKHFDNTGRILSRQFLRCGTSIGANCAEAEFAQSRKDYLSKLSIALKEAGETRYWIRLMIENNLASEVRFKPMVEELDQIIRILIAITKKLKE
jgi:four helix bundle protein